uniref:Ig-like domain-containing protein n=1 Tax=Anabas testudineus TaxID=64144 RepID=A0AAQ6ILV9_ANATE
MKTSSVSLLLGVSVLLLSGLTVSAVSLNLSPNRLQFFREESVSLSCVEDGQTVDGTVKRTRGGQTEDCGAPGSGFGNFTGSCCFMLSLDQSDSGVYWCETSSGRSRDQINFTVSGGELILEIPALPVLTGSDVTLRCRNRNDETVAAYFFKNNLTYDGSRSEFILSRVRPSDEGLYSCSTDTLGESPQSWLRVRDPPPTTSAPPSTTLCSSTLTSPLPDSLPPPPPSSSVLIPVAAVLGSLVLLVLVLVPVLWIKRKQTGRKDVSPPEDVTYADVAFRHADNRRGPAEVTYGEVVIKNQKKTTRRSGPADVTYGEVVIKNQKKKKAGSRTESTDPDVLYSSVRAGTITGN